MNDAQFCFKVGYEAAEKDAYIRRLEEEAETLRKDLDEATKAINELDVLKGALTVSSDKEYIFVDTKKMKEIVKIVEGEDEQV